jgi:hypothetical protein
MVKATWKTLFGKFNGGRTVVPQKLTYGGSSVTIDAGNQSPVWEKSFTEGNECRFTLREETRGMATYGDADPPVGAFAGYKHSVCYVRQVHSPVQPIVGFESQQNVAGVIDNLVDLEKEGLSTWMAKEIDLDAIRALFMGASAGLLKSTEGGLGLTLYGGSAGVQRSSFNTYVAGQSGLTSTSATLATHNSSLATALGTLSDDDAYAFNYATHERMSSYIEDLYYKPVKIGKDEYRAIAIIDRRNIHRMNAPGGQLSQLFLHGRERAKDNPALYHMDAIVLDDILYIPNRQVEFFRPSVSGGVVTYGCANTADPRATSFSNTSNITPTIYMGAGALLRGRRSKTAVTVDNGYHGNNQSYCLHYGDGWMRNDRFTKDGTTAMENDSTLICFNYDKGVGTTYGS